MNRIHNLPQPRTSFIGRSRELEKLSGLLRTHRLVTVMGPGGSGKTRIALEIAPRMAERLSGQVWFVPLEVITRAELLAAAVAEALGLPGSGLPTGAAIREILSGHSGLIILDNCEHLTDAAAALADEMLSAAPGLHILATSRERLGVSGEAVLRLPSLALVASGSAAPDELMETESVRLFIDRARLHDSTFRPEAENLLAIGRICRWLDGMPLAIELAAARVGALSPRQLEQRLSDLFPVLSRGDRTATPRQRTLLATMEWSYGLLTEAEREFLRSLGVFHGDFDLRAVASVCSLTGFEALDLLASLLDKSLVMTRETEGEQRYRLLEVVRQFSLARLKSAGEEEAVRLRHLQYYLSQAEESAGGDAPGAPWLKRIDRDLENHRAALDWACTAGLKPEARRMAGGLVPYWMSRGLFSEGAVWLERALALGDLPADRESAQLLLGAGRVAHRLGELDGALGRYREALKRFRALGDDRSTWRPLNNMGSIFREQGRLEEAGEALEQSIEVCRRAGDERLLALPLINLSTVMYYRGELQQAEMHGAEAVQILSRLDDRHGLALALVNLGNSCLWIGKIDLAEPLLREGLKIYRELGDPWGTALGLACTGLISLKQGRLERAREDLLQSLEMRQEMSDLIGVIESLEALAWVALEMGQPDAAAELLAHTDQARRSSGRAVPPIDRSHYDGYLERIRRQLGPAAFAAAWRAGLALSREEACSLASSRRAGSEQNVPFTPQGALGVLTPRQIEILNLVIKGLSAKEIGQRFHLSSRTVEKHEENMRARLGLPNRAALVAWAVQNRRP